MAKSSAVLELVDPDRIIANPDNPRLIFREDDMRALRESIQEVGIQVPLTVYRDKRKFVILDGERRWRCAKKLNLREVPVIIHPKPKPLENLLHMFNIHNVREDWDLIATALKLDEVREYLEKDGQSVDVRTLSRLTGLSAAMVRQCIYILDLPQKYIDMLIDEAHKPKAEQEITPDLFIEVYKSQRAIQRHTPEVFSEGITPRKYVDRMVSKYRTGVIKNVVSFRDVSRIARAENAGVGKEEVVPILRDLVQDSTYSVREAYDDSVKKAYEQRDIASRAAALADRLEAMDRRAKLSPEVRDALVRLSRVVEAMIRGR